jgi:hypothetical protein
MSTPISANSTTAMPTITQVFEKKSNIVAALSGELVDHERAKNSLPRGGKPGGDPVFVTMF